MLTNADKAKECLEHAADVLDNDGGWELANYWMARAQVYATLAVANSYADSR